MKKKHLFMALTLVMVGTLFTVLAQNKLVKTPFVGWFMNPFQAMKNASISLPVAKIMHDGDHYPTSGTFNNTLSNAVVSQHQDGDTVIVMSAKGELPGTLTLKLQRDAAGTTVTGGEWAFLVSYSEEVHNEDGTHSESLIQRGTVKGTISDGQVTLDANGSISAVNSVQLVLNGGTLSFHKATAGNGAGQATNILDNATSTGTLNLTF